MQALKVSNFGRVAGLDQRLESLLDQRSQPAAQHRLLAEQIALSLFLERSLQHARTSRANTVRVGQRVLMRPPARILLDGNQRRHAAPFAVYPAQEMPGTLRRDHDDIHIARRGDRLEMNAEAVRETQHLARMQIRLYELLIHRR